MSNEFRSISETHVTDSVPVHVESKTIESHVTSTRKDIKEEVKSVAQKILNGISTAYYHFKNYTDNYNKGLWIRAQKSQREQALDRAKLTPGEFVRLPWHQFLDPLYIKSKWVDKNIDFFLIMLRIVIPESKVRKENINISEIEEVLSALLHNDRFLSAYAKLLQRKRGAKKMLEELKKEVDDEYNAFIKDLRSNHTDKFGFELSETQEDHLKAKMVNDFVGNKFKSVGAVHTSRIGVRGGKKTRKRRVISN